MRLFWLFLLVVAVALLAPAHALAADAPKGEEKLDPFKGAVDLTVFTLLVFGILFFLLSKYAWPAIREGLDKREHSIAHDKNEAVKAKQEADALRAQFADQMARANDEIRAKMDKARADAQLTAAEELARGKAEIAAERERFKREMQISTDDALVKMFESTPQLATIISSKVIRKQLQYDDHRALLAEALAEFRQSAEGRKLELESARA